MSASQMALRGHIAQLEQDNLDLRIALSRTTKQLAETLEEYKLLRVPFFRRWRMRRLMERRKAEQMRAIQEQDKQAEEEFDEGDGEGPRVITPLAGRFLVQPPQIIVPGR